ncbi:hypothetical protein, partial [Raoultella ornithinolytica]|uniref:hypothetical protein n=3 Tax=Raoultella ornithinolytica TaxID=54291 RepID=UPI001F38E39D
IFNITVTATTFYPLYAFSYAPAYHAQKITSGATPWTTNHINVHKKANSTQLLTTKTPLKGIFYKRQRQSPDKSIKPKKSHKQNLLLLTLQNLGDEEYIVPC